MPSQTRKSISCTHVVSTLRDVVGDPCYRLSLSSCPLYHPVMFIHHSTTMTHSLTVRGIRSEEYLSRILMTRPDEPRVSNPSHFRSFLLLGLQQSRLKYSWKNFSDRILEGRILEALVYNILYVYNKCKRISFYVEPPKKAIDCAPCILWYFMKVIH